VVCCTGGADVRGAAGLVVIADGDAGGVLALTGATIDDGAALGATAGVEAPV
jgi:hypothetical protein